MQYYNILLQHYYRTTSNITTYYCNTTPTLPTILQHTTATLLPHYQQYYNILLQHYSHTTSNITTYYCNTITILPAILQHTHTTSTLSYEVTTTRIPLESHSQKHYGQSQEDGGKNESLAVHVVTLSLLSATSTVATATATPEHTASDQEGDGQHTTQAAHHQDGDPPRRKLERLTRDREGSSQKEKQTMKCGLSRANTSVQ